MSQRLIIIDDHPLFRKGLRDLLTMEPSLQLVGEAASGEEGLQRIGELIPDMVLLDINMKGMGGIEILKRIKAKNPHCSVVMLTVSDDSHDISSAIKAGADGYLLKDMEPEDTLKALMQISAGTPLFSPQITPHLINALRSNPVQNQPQECSLTPREMEISGVLSKGGSNKVIARELSISEATVKVHVKNILKKLQLRSRTEIAVWFLQQGA